MTDSELDATLRQSKPTQTMPPTFQAEVWRRIEVAEEFSLSRRWTRWLEPLLSWVAKPLVAMALSAAMIVGGLWLGGQQPNSEGKLAYVQSVSPFVVTPSRCGGGLGPRDFCKALSGPSPLPAHSEVFDLSLWHRGESGPQSRSVEGPSPGGLPRREEGDSPAEAADKGLTPEEAAVSGERLRAVRAALLALPADLREAMVLFIDEEMGYAEIATVAGCTAKAAETRIYRARQLLRESLKEVRQ